MPTGKDWVRLAKETFRAVDRRDVADLYRVEWRAAADALIGDEGTSMAAEPRKVRRFFRKANAVLYGLTRRLAPARRLLFVLAIFLLLQGNPTLVTDNRSGDKTDGHKSSVILLTVDVHWIGFLILTLLLGMELVDKIRFRSELEMARDLQADLLPRRLPTMAGFDFGACNRVANTVGGDLYDIESLPSGGVEVLFGDASGHGMAAGLVMAVTDAAFRSQLPVDTVPLSVMGTINRVLCRSGAFRASGPRHYFAGIVLRLERDGSFRAVVAGHPPPLRLSSAGDVLERVGAGSYPAGIREATSWREESGTLNPGETLLFYSDGLYENRDSAGREFGEERILAIVRRLAGASADALVAELAAEAIRFLDRRLPEDDVSMLAIRRAPSNTAREAPAAVLKGT